MWSQGLDRHNLKVLGMSKYVQGLDKSRMVWCKIQGFGSLGLYKLFQVMGMDSQKALGIILLGLGMGMN